MTTNQTLENTANLKHLGTTLTNKIIVAKLKIVLNSGNISYHSDSNVIVSSPPPGISPTPSPNQGYLTPGAFSYRPFPRILASLESGPQRLCSRDYSPRDTSPLPWPPLCFNNPGCTIRERMTKVHCWNTILHNNGHRLY
jgi:hypothetical protein